MLEKCVASTIKDARAISILAVNENDFISSFFDFGTFWLPKEI
jgi:hypothetical protein